LVRLVFNSAITDFAIPQSIVSSLYEPPLRIAIDPIARFPHAHVPLFPRPWPVAPPFARRFPRPRGPGDLAGDRLAFDPSRLTRAHRDLRGDRRTKQAEGRNTFFIFELRFLLRNATRCDKPVHAETVG